MGTEGGAYLAEWVTRHCEPGDLLLTGATDGISQLIQRVLRSRYSHAGVVILDSSGADLTVIEMYDYSFLRRDVFEGVWRTPIDAVVERSAGYLSDVKILRPDEDLDRSRLPAAADQVEQHAPTFPTVAALMLGALVVADRAGRTKLGEFVSRTDHADRLIARWIDAGGDGIRSATCAELAFGIYQAAGFTVTVDKPALRASMNRLLDANGDATFGATLTLEGSPPLESDTEDTLSFVDGTVATATNSAEMIVEGIAEMVMSTREAWAAEHETTLLDLMCPTDFLNSPQFHTVATARRTWGRWRAE